MKAALRGLYPRLLRAPARARALALGALLALIVRLSTTPGHAGGGVPDLASFLLNWLHQPLYGLLAVLIAALTGIHLPARRLAPVIAVILAAVAVGIVDEIIQAHTPERYSSAWDLGSDILGAALALTAAGWTARQGRPVLEAGPVLFCIGLSLAYNCIPACLPNLPLTALLP